MDHSRWRFKSSTSAPPALCRSRLRQLELSLQGAHSFSVDSRRHTWTGCVALARLGGGKIRKPSYIVPLEFLCQFSGLRWWKENRRGDVLMVPGKSWTFWGENRGRESKETAGRWEETRWARRWDTGALAQTWPPQFFHFWAAPHPVLG